MSTIPKEQLRIGGTSPKAGLLMLLWIRLLFRQLFAIPVEPEAIKFSSIRIVFIIGVDCMVWSTNETPHWYMDTIGKSIWLHCFSSCNDYFICEQRFPLWLRWEPTWSQGNITTALSGKRIHFGHFAESQCGIAILLNHCLSFLTKWIHVLGTSDHLVECNTEHFTTSMNTREIHEHHSQYDIDRIIWVIWLNFGALDEPLQIVILKEEIS